jgi:hypothetical protein
MTVTDRLNGLLSSVAIKAPCRAATTANITLDGEQTIDGVAVVSGDRVLVWNQTNNTANGIYVCDTGTWARDVDFNGSNQVVQGTIVAVMQGTQYGSTVFQQTTASPVIGSTAITFAVSGAAALALAAAVWRNTLFPLTTTAAILSALGGQTALGYTPLAPANNLSDLTNAATARTNLGISATATLRSYLAGLTTSNNSGTPNTKIDVTAGACTDDGNAVTFSSSSGTIDCGTTGANGLDTGSLATSTWYHVFAIAKAAGASPAFLASTSVNSPSMPATYTLKRRIASFKTDGSAHIVGYIQNGDNFRWKTPVNNVNAVPGVTTRTTLAVTVPTGLVVFPDLVAIVTAGAAGVNLLLTSLDETDSAPSGTLQQQASGSAGAAASGTSIATLHTDTSAQIGYRVSTTDSGVVITTFGWRDTRGRDA